jgi:hypothetical protein
MFKYNIIIWRLDFNYLLIQDIGGMGEVCKLSCGSVTGWNRNTDWMVRSWELPLAVVWEVTDACGLVRHSTGSSSYVTLLISIHQLQRFVTLDLTQLTFTHLLVGNFYQAFCSKSNQRLILSYFSYAVFSKLREGDGCLSCDCPSTWVTAFFWLVLFIFYFTFGICTKIFDRFRVFLNKISQK